MGTLIASLGAWNWFIAGGLLLIVEIIAPGTFMLWLGLSALLVGLISLAVDWPWQAQFVAFAAFSVGMIPLWRRLAARVGAPNDQPFLNRRAHAFVGRIFTLDKPIIDGRGTMAIDDSIWRISGPDCPAGSRVKVTQVEGGSLRVEPTAT
jgi:membrane protein implicated in regulation of membrane protease activity